MPLSLHQRFSQGAARGAGAKVLTLVASDPVRSVQAWAEASMNIVLVSAWNLASVHAAPRCAPLRLAPGCAYAEQVGSGQASGLVGRMSSRSIQHHRPNQPLKGTRREASSCFAGIVPARPLAAFRSASCGGAGRGSVCGMQAITADPVVADAAKGPVVLRGLHPTGAGW